MVSEKRFVAEQVDVVNEDETEVWDVVFDTENTYAFMVRDTDTASDLCDLLNEQQEHITHLEDTNDNFRIKLIEDIEAMEQAEKKIDEQQDTINKLRKILAEAEDTIEIRLAEHYLKEYENIKQHIIGDNDG